MTYKSGAVNNEYLLAFLRDALSRFTEFGRDIVIGSVNASNGVYVEFDQKNILFSEVPDAAVASASIPLVFPPHIWEGSQLSGTFMDGGTVYNINPEGAVRQCLDGIVDDESKIIMDIYICGASEAPDQIDESGNGWENYFRGRSIGKWYGSTNSVSYFTKAHPDVQLRHVVLQTEGHMGGLSELNFEGSFTQAAQDQGKLDAQNALNGTTNFANIFTEWNGDQNLRNRYEQVGDYIK